MNDNWKPGDVAFVNGHVGFVWDDEMFVYTDSDGDAVSTWLVGSGARRLVVIDPENEDDVTRLADALVDHHSRAYGVESDWLSIQAALREFANPTPPIEEPTGWGAVVEDKTGAYWTLYAPEAGVWINYAEGKRRWHEIFPVRIVSEGVTS